MTDSLLPPLITRAHIVPEVPPERGSPPILYRPDPVGARVLLLSASFAGGSSPRARWVRFAVFDRADGALRPATGSADPGAPVAGLMLGPALTSEERSMVVVAAQAVGLPCLDGATFAHRVFYPEAFVVGAQATMWSPEALVGIAVGWGAGRKRREDFVLYLCRHGGCPPIRLTVHEGPVAFLRFGQRGSPLDRSGRVVDKWKVPNFPGRFCLMHALAHGLTGADHTLRSACEAFDVPLPPPPLPDTVGLGEQIHHHEETFRVEVRLYETLDREAYRHVHVVTDHNEARRTKPRVRGPLSVPAFQSPPMLVKGYLRRMGINGPPPLVPAPNLGLTIEQIQGACMAAMHGSSRSECRIRLTAVEGTYGDVRSMFPFAAIRMDLWRFYIADVIEAVPCTEEARDLLVRASVDLVLTKDLGPQLPTICVTQPREDIVPLRTRRDDAGGVHTLLPYLTVPESLGPVPYTLAHCLASALLTGRPPEVLSAFRLVPRGVRRGLRPVRFGDLLLDPRRDGLPLELVEARHKLARAGTPHLAYAAKIAANALVWGLPGEYHGRRARPALAYDGCGVPLRVREYEEPGPFAFPALAPWAPAYADLVMAALEVLIHEMGAEYAMMGIDSLFVAKTERAPDPLVVFQALSERVEVLNPFRTVRPLLRLGEEHGTPATPLWYFGVAGGRYCLFRPRTGRAGPEIVKASAHALPYVDPATGEPPRAGGDTPAWVKEHWKRILIRHASHHPGSAPSWFAAPAFSVTRFSSPEQRPLFAALAREEKPWPLARAAFAGVSVLDGAPWWPGYCAARRRRVERCPRPQGFCPHRRACPIGKAILPCASMGSRGPDLSRLIDAHTGWPLVILDEQHLDAAPRPGTVSLLTHGDVAQMHTEYEEVRSLDGDGRGVLERPRVVASGRAICWKESGRKVLSVGPDRLAPPERLVVLDERETLRRWTEARDILRGVPCRHRDLIAHFADLSERRLRDALSGRSMPRGERRARLMQWADAYRASGGRIAALQDLDGPARTPRRHPGGLPEAMRQIPKRWIAREAQLPERTITRIRNGHVAPRPETETRLWRAVRAWENRETTAP
jgi:hypothetical protein